MSQNHLSVAFIGCGRHACDSLLPSLRYVPEIDLTCVCDINEERAKQTAQLFGASSYYTSIEKMLNDRKDLSAAVISVGGRLHPELTAVCLKAGLHVLVEKPPAMTFAETQNMVQEAQQAGKHVMVAFKKRFCTVYQKAREIITSDAFGPVSRIDVKFDMGRPKDAPDDSSTAEFTAAHARSNLSGGIHLLDLARFLVGDITSLYSVCGRCATHVAAVTYACGAVGTFSFGRSQSPQGPMERVEITGCGASIIVENQITLWYYRKAGNPRLEGTYIVPEEEAPLVYTPQFSLSSRENKALFFGGYVGELRHFAQALLAGDAPSPDIADGLESMKLLESLEASVGTRISID